MASKLIDYELIEELRELSDDDPDFWNDLLGVFESEAPQMMQQIHTYLIEKNDVLFRKTSHRLIGAAGNLGSIELVELLRQAEQLIKDQAFETVTQMMPSIDASLQATLVEMRRLAKQFKA